MKLPHPFRALSLALLMGGAAILCAPASAQGPGSGGAHGGPGMGMPGGGGRGAGMPSRGGMDGGGPRNGNPSDANGTPNGNTHGGLQVGPPGRWWDDRKFAKSLGLNGDQQRKMDSVFSQNRDLLVSRFDNLKQAQSKLDALTKSSHPSEAALSAEIDHVAQARADLEKSYTHMLLQIREEMTPEQINKLEDHH